MGTRQPVYVPLEHDERELLLQLLNAVGFEIVQSRDYEKSYGKDVSRLVQEEAQIGVMYERIEQGVPLPRADVIRALRLIERLLMVGWPPAKIGDAQHLYTVLKARCANVLRLARQEETVSC